MNGLKTALLLGLLSGLLIVGGRLVAGENGMLIALFIAIGMNFFSYFSPTRSPWHRAAQCA